MATQAPPYDYEPLSTDHIRLLRLSPSRQGDPLKGSLEIVNLTHDPTYEALSYEWGLPEKSHDLIVNGRSVVRITESLFQALQDLRPELPTGGGNCRVVWADAICINQDDIDERQHQVSIMGTIYRKASRVITYIGPERDDSTEGIMLAARLVSFQYSEDVITLNVDRRNNARLAHLGLPSATDPGWQALKALCLRGWAGRCWCAQEFLCNGELVMMCGRVVIPHWALLPRIVRLVYARSLPASLLPGYEEDPNCLRDCLVSLLDLRTSLAEFDTFRPPLYRLLDLLQSFHPFRATDARDKVYALISHCTDQSDLGILVDYTISAEQLYTTVAARILAKYQDLYLLLSNLHEKSLDIPSWVPDWSTWYFGSDLAGAGFDATHSASGSTSVELHIDEAERKLGISGCLVDKISWVGDEILPYYTTHTGPVAAQRKAWFGEQVELLRRLEPYPAGGTDIVEVLWKTLVSNTTHEEMWADGDYAAFFEAHLNITTNSPPDRDDMARRFCDAVRWRSRYRRLCTTAKGYVGAVPQTAQVGDWVCMFHGARHLFVVRPRGPDFAYVGHSYVHGLMTGQVLKAEWYSRQIITLA